MKTPNETNGGAGIAPVQAIRVTDIVPDPNNQTRGENIDVLAASIEREGLLQPIVVRKHPDPKSQKPWMIVAGERRWQAHVKLKRETIEARVRPESLSDDRLDAARKRHAENFHREDLSPIQKARALQELFDLKMPQAEIAKFVGAKDQSTVSNFCRLLRLPEDVQTWVHEGKLTSAHGKALLRFEKHPKLLTKIAALVSEKGATSKALEKGLPFADDLVSAGLVHEFGWDVATLQDLPEARRNDPDFMEAENEYQEVSVFCLEPNKGKAVEKEVEAAERAKNARGSRGVASAGGGGGGMTEAQKKERAATIAKNRAAREAIETALREARKRVQRMDTLTAVPEVLHVVLEAAVENGRYGDALKDAAKSLGVELGARRRGAGYRVFEHGELQDMEPHDAVRVVALAVMMRQAEEAKRFAAAVPDCVEHVAEATLPIVDPDVGDVVAWDDDTREGVVISIGDYTKTGLAWSLAWNGMCTPVRLTKAPQLHLAGPLTVVKTAALRIVRKAIKAPASLVQALAKPPAKKRAAKKPAAVKPKAKTRAVITTATRLAVKNLVFEGRTGAEIAKMVGISLPSVQNIKKALGLVKAKKGGRK